MYHVVTEKPMQPGQIIIFDENRYNGIYNRVTACKKILDGDHSMDELSNFINSNLEYWTVRTYRELALEKVRKEKYTNYPSRMSCLYTSKTLSGAEMWAASFMNSNRKVYQIVKLRTMAATIRLNELSNISSNNKRKIHRLCFGKRISCVFRRH